MEISTYCENHSLIISSEVKEIGDQTQSLHGAQMLAGTLVCGFLGGLLRTSGARAVLEIGTFTGQTTLFLAEQLPEDGMVVTLDINEKTVALGKSIWEKSTSGHKIKSIIGAATNYLKDCPQKYDLIFIDADKKMYGEYLDLCLPLLNDKGCIVIDNCLWGGSVVNIEANFKPQNHRDEVAKYLASFNQTLANRNDLWSCLLPIRDGLFLAMKK
jgi:caffeoyl-CoA O-methyltransferase